LGKKKSKPTTTSEGKKKGKTPSIRNWERDRNTGPSAERGHEERGDYTERTDGRRTGKKKVAGRPDLVGGKRN